MKNYIYVWIYACVIAKSLQSCLTLCDPIDCRLPGSSVHGILQTKILEWVTMPSSRRSSPPRDWTHDVSCIYDIAGGFFITESPGKPIYVYVCVCVCLPATCETRVRSLGWEDPLEEGMATHSSIRAWRIPMDRGAWWATVHGVAKSRTWLSD